MNALVSFISDQLKEQQADLAAAVAHPLWRKASAFAADVHGAAEGAALPPAFAHATRVAVMVSALFRCQDMAVLTTALLHNVLEETDTCFEDLETHFGRLVASRVERLSRDPDLDELVHIKRLQACDWQTRLVMLADAADHLTDEGGEADARVRHAFSVLDLASGMEQPVQRAHRLLIELLDQMGALSFTHANPGTGEDDHAPGLPSRTGSSSTLSQHLPEAAWMRG